MSGPRGLGTLLRHLVELLDRDVQAAYKGAGLSYRPKFTPVLRALLNQEPLTIKEIARSSGITHSAASQTVSQMSREGLVSATPGDDARERRISLTPEARALIPKLRTHWRATAEAAASLSQDIGVPLDEILERAIASLNERPYRDRIAAARRSSDKH